MEDDKKPKFLHPQRETGMAHRGVSIEVVKSAFVAEGLGVTEIADRYHLSLDAVQRLIQDHQLVELRKAYMREGLAKIQNVQLGQAERMMNLELDFKKLRLIQLEDKLKEFAAYYARHGDFFKRHPVSGAVLRDTDGLAMQLSVPSVTKEIMQIKESLTLSEGLKKLIGHIDDIINGKPKQDSITDGGGDVIEMDVDGFFKKK